MGFTFDTLNAALLLKSATSINVITLQQLLLLLVRMNNNHFYLMLYNIIQWMLLWCSRTAIPDDEISTFST